MGKVRLWVTEKTIITLHTYTMKKVINYLFPEKTKWVDIGTCDVSGVYYVVQMRATIKTNRKQFRMARIGFVNDHAAKSNLYTNSLLQIS